MNNYLVWPSGQNMISRRERRQWFEGKKVTSEIGRGTTYSRAAYPKTDLKKVKGELIVKQRSEPDNTIGLKHLQTLYNYLKDVREGNMMPNPIRYVKNKKRRLKEKAGKLMRKFNLINSGKY